MRVLDYGYVELRDLQGNEARIIEAARMSSGRGFLGWGPIHASVCTSQTDAPCNCTPKPGDERLLAYLWNHRHTTPFEQVGFSLEVQAPIMVFREWHRHRTQAYNEFSARYAQMSNLHYVPSLERIQQMSGTNKQAQGLTPLTADEGMIRSWLAEAATLQQVVYDHYERGLSIGIPKEVARLNTPVARYSRMVVNANLLNWLRFLGLRLAPGAQYEIREYAQAVASIVRDCFPQTWALFQEKPI